MMHLKGVNMDIQKKTVLQKYREKIVEELDVNHITDDLYSKLVINNDDREKILSEVCTNINESL